MFSLEINFQDGVSQPEMLFVRRPQAIVGASDFAHVVIDDMKPLDYQIRLIRGLGRKFSCQAISHQGQLDSSNVLNGVYDGEAEFDLGVVRLVVSALDSDLMLKEGEPPDRAGVRVLRQACALKSPKLPAVMVAGAYPMIVSFSPDQPIQIGRSKKCALRLDSADISSEHARIGFESGEFWIEDLGSTNGTFCNGQQISGRQALGSGVPVILGREITIIGVTSEQQIQQSSRAASSAAPIAAVETHYPMLVSLSELARPPRFALQPGSICNIGRDPASDIWIGAPHVSRRHCSITFSKGGRLEVTDQSTNGMAYDQGMLDRGEPLDVTDRPSVFDFGSGVTVALCFDSEQEKKFVDARGALNAFGPQLGSTGVRNSSHPQIEVGQSSIALASIAAAGLSSRMIDRVRGMGMLGKVVFVGVCLLLLVIILNVLFPLVRIF